MGRFSGRIVPMRLKRTAASTPSGNIYSVTVDYTKCGTADSSNFPMLFYGTYDGTGGEPDLKTVANGGAVKNANGYDICFYSDVACTTMLDFERVSYSATTGAVEFYVKIPTLSHTTNTVIYLKFGDASITTDQQDADGTWDTQFKGVYHMQGNSNDSSGNARNGTDSSMTYSTTNAKLSQSGNHGGDIGLSNTGLPTVNEAISVAGWFRPTNVDVVWRAPFNMGQNAVGQRFGWLQNGTVMYTVCGASITMTSTFGAATWVRLWATHDGTTTRSYANGSADNTNAGTNNLNYGTVVIGDSNLGGDNFVGISDEVYITNNAVSASWITADYNNQNSPDTFYTLAAV